MKNKNKSVEKLEVGKDYVNVYDSDIIIIDRVGNANNNGFNGVCFYKTRNCAVEPYWREATKEEVIGAFKKHLVHRYGENWETMKVKEKHPYSILGISDSSWSVEISKSSKGWDVWNENALLYRDGIWVDRLEEPKIHIKEAIKEDTVIHCETEEEANRILGMAHELGYRWCTGDGYKNNTKWEDYKEETCYNIFVGHYGYVKFSESNNQIIPSTQIADLEEKKSDKKRYEVIKTTFSDFKQLSLGDNKTNRIVAHFVEQDEETVLLAEKIVDILNLINK